MTVIRREYAGAAAAASLVGNITLSDLTITIDDATNWPGLSGNEFWIVIDRDTATEEKIRCSLRSGNVITVSARGEDDTSAVAHQNGATVEHALSATDIDELNRHAADTTQDDHPQYVHISTARTITAGHTFTSKQNLVSSAVGVPMLRIGGPVANSHQYALTITPYGAAHTVFASGAEYSGGVSTARAASATQLVMMNDAVDIYTDTTLTAGNSYTPTQRLRVNSTGINIGGPANKFGTGAISGTGGWVNVGDFGDTASVYFQAASNASNMHIQIQAKGTGSIYLMNQGGTTVAQFGTPTGSFTSITTYLPVVSANRTLEVGAADSGGAGYRMVRVAN